MNLKALAGAVFAMAGTYSNVRTSKNLVIRDAKSFTAVWKEHVGTGQAPLPSVDFKKYDVIAIFIGPKPTGGHTVKIDEVKRNKNEAEVTATLSKPGPGTLTTQAFTYPYVMKAVPKLPATVKFNIREQIAPPPK
jgi:hypothetical protein